MKKKLAIISVLKPVNDPRNYKKIGISLARSHKYEIYTIGFSCKSIPVYPNIHFLPLPFFSRLSFARIISSWKIHRKLLKVKPDVIICTTHDLLIVSMLNKILFGTKIIYDIQENYFKNILLSRAFPRWVRPLIAGFVRLKEMLLAPFFDFFFLAEQCYKQELPFIGNRYVVVENKYQGELVPTPKKPPGDKITLIYSGTIAEEYGVFEAIKLTSSLRQYFSDIRLKIIGHCPNKNTLSALRKAVEKLAYVDLPGSGELVPHEVIIDELTQADFAVLPYRLNTYYSNRIPTKIYECLSLKTPMIVRNNPAWRHLFNEFDAFIFSDFENADPEIARLMKQYAFYTKGDSDLAHWNSEQTKVVGSINNLFEI